MSQNTPKTELLYNKSKPIDHMNVSEGISLMIQEQRDASIEVEKASKSIEITIDAIFRHLISNPKGRLIYVGAGTSARIGIQDGVELFPTFNWPKERLDFIIAGGPQALLKAVENAEDDIKMAEKNVSEKLICNKDIVIGLAASGNTPFTCKVLEKAKVQNALTVAISNNDKGKILTFGDHKIILNTKQEVIAGSTRLKAATAQKICLNIISTMVMVKMGRVENGLMKNMVPTNQKLRDRKIFINKNIPSQ